MRLDVSSVSYEELRLALERARMVPRAIVRRGASVVLELEPSELREPFADLAGISSVSF